MAQKLACGDTQWCSKCTDYCEESGKIFTENGLGRCDFYRGPGMKLSKAVSDSSGNVTGVISETDA